MVKSEMSDMDDNSTKGSSNPPSPMIEVVDDQENKSTNSDRQHLADQQVSFSPTFYKHFFANILAPKNFKPQKQLCNFWLQNMSTKCAPKMLMKLTPGVNFTNILRENIR
jgi:hypothetical protein